VEGRYTWKDGQRDGVDCVKPMEWGNATESPSHSNRAWAIESLDQRNEARKWWFGEIFYCIVVGNGGYGRRSKGPNCFFKVQRI
jgi:hypothetical protein